MVLFLCNLGGGTYVFATLREFSPIVPPQQVSTAFKGKNKKALEALDKLAFELPKKAVRDAETKAAHDKAYLEAHTKAGKVMQEVIANMKNGILFPKTELTPEQAMIERMNGMAYAAAGRSKEEMQTRLMNELMAGHTDFVAGAKEYLAKDAAKNAYKK